MWLAVNILLHQCYSYESTPGMQIPLAWKVTLAKWHILYKKTEYNVIYIITEIHFKFTEG